MQNTHYLTNEHKKSSSTAVVPPPATTKVPSGGGGRRRKGEGEGEGWGGARKAEWSVRSNVLSTEERDLGNDLMIKMSLLRETSINQLQNHRNTLKKT